jgi:hypothetical protein
MATEYLRGEHVLVIAETEPYDVNTGEFAGAEVDAEYPKVSILNQLGATVLAATTMTATTVTGRYYHDFEIPADAVRGTYRVCVESRADAKVTVEMETFTVVVEGKCR